MAWALQPGTLLGHGAWFSSGFPGGVDYVMLVMVKKGWLDPLEEKRINRQIMVSKGFEAMKAGKSAIRPKSSPNLNSCSIKISHRGTSL